MSVVNWGFSISLPRNFNNVWITWYTVFFRKNVIIHIHWGIIEHPDVQKKISTLFRSIRIQVPVSSQLAKFPLLPIAIIKSAFFSKISGDTIFYSRLINRCPRTIDKGTRVIVKVFFFLVEYRPKFKTFYPRLHCCRHIFFYSSCQLGTCKSGGCTGATYTRYYVVYDCNRKITRPRLLRDGAKTRRRLLHFCQ